MFSSPATGAVSSGGGLGIPGIPEVSNVICLTGCTKVREGSVGGSIQITGRDMESVAYVAFRGKKKNIRVKPEQVTRTRVEAKIPEGAKTGRIRAVSATGSVSEPSRQIIEISDRAFVRDGKLTVTYASTTPRRAYQFGVRRPVLKFIVHAASSKVDLRVDVVNHKDEVVRSRFLTDVPTGSTQKVGWNGRVAKKRAAPNGAYRFVVRGNGGATASLSKRLKRVRRRAARSSRTRNRKAADPFSFRMFGFMFPVRGAHSYGDSIGAGRGHQGQDLLAKCGLPLRAARGGIVYYNDYQASGAGNYLVIDTWGTRGKSHVYMHMPRRSHLKVGARVRTGQIIGRVGTTGRSSACHLHFEMWSGPGWYQGGTLINPTRALRYWDRYS